MKDDRILVIGACGQIGAELTACLRQHWGNDHVIAADIRENPDAGHGEGPFETLDVLDKDRYAEIVRKYRINQIYNLAAILSATGEKFPMKAWKLNMDGLIFTLDIAKDNAVQKVYWPSSIAVFGPTTPRTNTPQVTVMEPETIYGISKLAGERWCAWYHKKFGLDVRSIRYPGLISYKTAPGGGTTDYAVDIYFQAVKAKQYTCFLEENTKLPMMYMPDAIRATCELMDAPADAIRVRSSYNVAAMTLDPGIMAEAIREKIPEFAIHYAPDYRQQIASAWPESIDDSAARSDWGWKPEYDLAAMTEDMLAHVQ